MTQLSLKTKYAYGVGHILNDLCSALWFSYLIIYFHHVQLFPNTLAGVVLLIGQIADALSTPFIGHEADRSDDLLICVKYGRRKTWHLVGTICVVCTFSFIFLGCLGCQQGSDSWAKVIYFAPFIIIFQFGWACIQISHLALLPTMSSDPNERTELNAIRYAFTVISTITVYLITWLILGISTTKPTDIIGPEDASKFVMLVFIALCIGIFFTVVFHLLIHENNLPCLPLNSGAEGSVITHYPMIWKDWLYEPQFYQIGVLYMGTRLFCNLTQVYIPLYLEDTLLLNEKSIAYIPLVMYISGLITAFVMKPVNKFTGRKITFLIGCALAGSGVLWVYFGESDVYRRYYLYAVAILLGSGGSTMLITILSLTADMIGSNVECGAFVYGSLSFSDKISNGLVVMIIQYFTPCLNCCVKCKEYFREVIGYACGGSILLSFFALLTLLPTKVGLKSSYLACQDQPRNDIIKSSHDDNDDCTPRHWSSSETVYSRLSQSEEAEASSFRTNLDSRETTSPIRS